MSIDAEYLLARLPAFYRERDADLGGPLRALLEVLAEQGQLLEADIEQLYDNWFIETCDDWLVPYIGDLLGVRGLHAVSGTGSFSQRALVANTLRLRRRKGTVPVLEQLAFDSSGWRARAVEFFELLGTTQQVNHRRLHSLRTPDLRQAARLERIDGPFDYSAHTAEVRHPSAGRYNIANLGLYLWRLQAYPVQRSQACAIAGMAGCYSFDPLGRSFVDDPLQWDGMLFNRPRNESEVTQLAQPVNVPEPLSRRVLYDELTALRQALADGGSGRLEYFAAVQNGPVLRIWLDGVAVPAEHLLVCNLTAIPGVSPEAWRRPPAFLDVLPTAGGPARRFPPAPPQFLVGFDPVLGRISLPTGKSATRVEVSWAYGFPGDVGGGPYDRRPVSAEDDARQGLFEAADFQTLLNVPGDFASLELALQSLQAGGRYLIRLLADSTESITSSLDLPDTLVAIEAANQRRPVLSGDLLLRGNGDTRLLLSGLLLDGKLRLQGDLRQVSLRHCSLVPARGGIHHESASQGRMLSIELTHCLCGALRCEGALAAVTARYSVFDNPAGEALALPDTGLELNCCTVFGATRSGALTASNSLFSAALLTTRRQQGCVRFCYVPEGSKTPRRYRCQPDLAIQGKPAAKAKLERIRVSPTFTSTTFGHPAYAQLRLSCAEDIRSGAEDGAEMGVWNLLQQPQREANLRQALDEYLRFGLEAGVIFVN
ncbi:hypothetical protein A9179_15460 [Pseudomonas alcaligenes]|uniref:Post-SET domain-containing protein n=1 Tax=Aquipseudomonas alcaligenes TaxID=43263 RepID=A0ABR7S4D4_AQUAC|nr:hypothetical protein [Pseudomonas alcaligenes]MBC9251670.1 hypothetical protein [Pseudomonas alcaligenes]